MTHYRKYRVEVLAATPSPLNLPYRIVDAQQGLVGIDASIRRPTRVAIIGAGDTKAFAPLNDPSWEVWGLNNCATVDKNGKLRADRWWDYHAYVAQNQADLGFLKVCPMPVYMPAVYPDIPNSVRLPIEAITPGTQDLFGCTFCYQIALALAEGFQEIGLFGVDLDQGSARERTIERLTTLWWLGFAQGRGVTITHPKASTLLVHPYHYGDAYHEEIAYVNAYLEEIAMAVAPWDEKAPA